MQAELEILDEIRLHYSELAPKISDNISCIKQKLSSVQEDDTVKTTYEQCENIKLQQKLLNRRDKKKSEIPTTTDRIKDLDQGKTEDRKKQRQRPPNPRQNQ